MADPILTDVSNAAKTEAAKVEAEAKGFIATFLAKTFTAKTLLIVAAASFVAGLLAHVL